MRAYGVRSKFFLNCLLLLPLNLFDKMGRGKEAAAKGLEKQRARAKAEGAQTKHAGEDAEVVNLPQRYTNPEESGLSLDVTGGKQTYHIKLE